MIRSNTQFVEPDKKLLIYPNESITSRIKAIYKTHLFGINAAE